MTSNARPPVVHGPGEGRTYDLGRGSAIFKADGDESAGRYAISEWWLDPHTKGPGAHHHDDDDVFYVLEGTLSVLVDGTWTDAAAGSIVVVPGGTTHAFDNRGDARTGFLNISAPGGFEEKMPGISEWFRARTPDESEC